MCTRHPDFERVRALATVIVGPITTVSIDSPSFEAWIVNAVICPFEEKAGGRYAVGFSLRLPARRQVPPQCWANPDPVWLMSG
jgi:hypothetical protein